MIAISGKRNCIEHNFPNTNCDLCEYNHKNNS